MIFTQTNYVGKTRQPRQTVASNLKIMSCDSEKLCLNSDQSPCCTVQNFVATISAAGAHSARIGSHCRRHVVPRAVRHHPSIIRHPPQPPPWRADNTPERRLPPPPPRPAADPLRPAWQRTPPDWWRHLDSSVCTELNKTSSGQRSICPSPIRRRPALIENNTAMHCHFAQGLLAIRVRQIHGPALRCPTVSPLTLSDDITCPCSCPSPPDPKRHCPISYLPKPPRPARP